MTTTRWLLALAMTTGACARAKAPAPRPPAPETVAPISMVILGVGGPGSFEGEAFDALFDAPQVTAAGERLLQRLSEDPQLAPLYSGLLSSLMAQPSLVQAMVQVAQDQPDASVEDVSEEIANRLSAGIDSPAFDAALDASLDRLLDRPAVDQAFERLATRMLERGRFTDRLAELLLRWQPDLEAAVGVPLDDPSFGARFDEHLAQPARAQAVDAVLRHYLVDDPSIAIAIAALVDDDAFFAATAGLVQDVLTSDGFEAHATEVFVGMIVGVDAAELARRVDAVLVSPSNEQAVVRWVDEVTAAPAFDGLAEQLGAMLDDPAIQAELYDALVGTPRRITA